MSDALTDIARDDRRAEAKEEYWVLMFSYLQFFQTYGSDHKKTKSMKKKLIDSAKAVDLIGGGYFSSKTNINIRLEGRLLLLENKDKKEWAKLLTEVNREASVYNLIKSISPFKNKHFISVQYGMGFVNLSGDIQEFIDKHLKDKGIYKGDHYSIFIDDKSLKSIETIQTR